MIKKCANPNCNNTFEVKPSEYNRRKHCSVACMSLGYRKVNWPSKKELSTKIHEYTWKELGDMYEVSPSAVRKWAKKYGLSKIT